MFCNGELIERYEYTPYGQRTVYSHGWLVVDLNADNAVTSADYDIITTWYNDDSIPPEHIIEYGDGVVGVAELGMYGGWNGTYLPGGDDPMVMYPHMTSHVLLGDLNPFGICEVGHQGLLYDREFGLYYNRTRMLQPTLGRFLQPDPLGYVDDMSLYLYARSSPLVLLDPWGRMSVGACRDYWREYWLYPWVRLLANYRSYIGYYQHYEKKIDELVAEIWEDKRLYKIDPRKNSKWKDLADAIQLRGKYADRIRIAKFLLKEGHERALIAYWMWREGCNCGRLRDDSHSLSNADAFIFNLPGIPTGTSAPEIVEWIMQQFSEDELDQALQRAVKNLRDIAFDRLEKDTFGICCLVHVRNRMLVLPKPTDWEELFRRNFSIAKPGDWRRNLLVGAGWTKSEQYKD